jgi:AraC family transcriptional regulator
LHAAEADDVDFVSIRIQPALVNEMAAEMGLTRATAEIVFRVTHTADEPLSAIARRIAAEASEERAGQQLMLDALVRELTVHLLRSYLTVRKSAQIELSRVGPVDRRLRRALEFMHDNYSRELALEEIATAAYLSEYHFARLFKQVTGATPHVYLANLRIEKARRLLAETAHPIIEVAAMVGYQSQSHFTKIFKAITGLTPRAYRESSKQ